MNRRSQYGNRSSKYSNRSTGITYAQAVRKREMLIEEISSLVAQKLARDGQYYLNESNRELLEEGMLENLTLAGILALGGLSVSAKDAPNSPAIDSLNIQMKKDVSVDSIAPELKRLSDKTKEVVGTSEVMFAIAAIEGLDLKGNKTDRDMYLKVLPNYAYIGEGTDEDVAYNVEELLDKAYTVALASRGVARMKVPAQAYPVGVKDYIAGLKGNAGIRILGTGEKLTNVRDVNGKLRLPVSKKKAEKDLLSLFTASKAAGMSSYDIYETIKEITTSLSKDFSFRDPNE